MTSDSSNATPQSSHTAGRVEITLVAALDENGLIGAGGGMPWYLPADLRHFKRVTLYKPIVMGRRTFEAIGRPLPQRRNIVLTRDRSFVAAGCEIVTTLQQARALAADAEAMQLMVIGGAQVYAAALPHADCLHITRIHARFDGDTWFPQVDWRGWRLVASEELAADGDRPACTFMQWRR